MARPMVLVVGASGTLGRPAVERLLGRGVPVRALTRQPERLGALAARGVEVVAGDLADPPSLRHACAGAEGVLASAHALLGRGEQRSERIDGDGHRALVDAAAASGVRRFVYVSAFGASPDHPVDFFRTKHALERYVAGSGLGHVILRPTAFMEQHAHEFNGKAVLERGRAFLLGSGQKPRNFVAAADVAQVAVEALLAERPPGPVVEIGGPDNCSNAEVAALYARLSGRPLRITRLPPSVARALAAVVAPLHPGVARLLRLSGLPDEAFDERFLGSEAVERTFGLRLTRLSEFVRERVRAAGITPVD